MVSVMLTSHYQSPRKVDPLYTAEVDSRELTDVPADWFSCMFLLSCDCQCVSLSRAAVRWSVVSDCDLSWSYLLF